MRTTKLETIAILIAAAAAAQSVPIDTARSSITIHTAKAGLLAAAGHEHSINAPISSGTLTPSAVEFKVESAKLTVKPDPKVDAKTQAQIQKDMETMVLEPSKYPEITFHSTRVEKSGDEWKVEGTLTLHGVTKPISLSVKRSGDAYTGRTTLKQTDFGIKPISVAGGTIKVKNEIEVSFEIFSH